MRAAPLLLALALAGSSTVAFGDPATIDVRLEPAEISVGDPVTATLTLTLGEAPADAPVFPEWTQGWGDAEVLAVSPVESGREGDRFVYRETVKLTHFRPGAHALPPVNVRSSGGEALGSTPIDLKLKVRSVLPEKADGVAPQPPAPPRPLSVRRAFFFAAGLGLAALAVAALMLARRLRAERAAARPPVPPFDELLAALAALNAADPIPGHTALSHAMRRYLGRRLEFHAVEGTTAEIQRALASRRDPEIPSELARRWVTLLRDCDQVKFARKAAGTANWATRRSAARALAAEIESLAAARSLPETAA